MTPNLCRHCGREIAPGDQAVSAFERVVVAATDDETPDLRGDRALFHLDCSPEWGDPAWVSRAEGPLSDLER